MKFCGCYWDSCYFQLFNGLEIAVHTPNHFLSHTEQSDSEVKIANKNSYMSSGENLLVLPKTVRYAH